MITCPRCNAKYQEFQFECDQCGASLPLPPADGSGPERSADLANDDPIAPSMPPRQVPQMALGRLLRSQPGAILGGIFLLVELFILVVVTIAMSPIFRTSGSLFFILFNLGFIVIGAVLFIRGLQKALRTVKILRDGQAALGEITDVSQNYRVRINNRHPWIIQYEFKVFGSHYQGELSTLSQPDADYQPGKVIYVLYQQDDPQKNTLYPGIFGYF
jgi:hypothetical protein